MAERIWIQPRTRLQTVWRVHVDAQGCMGWHAFTSCPDARAPYQDMLGVGLLMCDNGTAYRTNWQPDKTDEWRFFP